MNLLEKLRSWQRQFRYLAAGEDPAFIPLTAEELTVVASDCLTFTRSERFMTEAPTAEVFGMGVFSTPFAEDMRWRQIDMAVTQLEESVEISWYKAYVEDDKEYCKLRYRLAARICHDTTRLDLTFEWDIFAACKRKLRITKWFPVKTRTVRIDGRVLYPYLKVTLPHNRHHATFTHVQ